MQVSVLTRRSQVYLPEVSIPDISADKVAASKSQQEPHNLTAVIPVLSG